MKFVTRLRGLETLRRRLGQLAPSRSNGRQR